MNISRHALASLAAVALLTTPALAQETIRVGLPTKTYWPTTVAETAVRQKLFEEWMAKESGASLPEVVIILVLALVLGAAAPGAPCVRYPGTPCPGGMMGTTASGANALSAGGRTTTARVQRAG